MAVYFFEDFTRKIIILNYLGISCLIQNLRYTNRNHCPSHEMWSYERDGRWWGWSFVRGSTVLWISMLRIVTVVWKISFHSIVVPIGPVLNFSCYHGSETCFWSNLGFFCSHIYKKNNLKHASLKMSTACSSWKFLNTGVVCELYLAFDMNLTAFLQCLYAWAYIETPCCYSII